eukprot:2261456-Alexandrium_andersonii.AAC.1
MAEAQRGQHQLAAGHPASPAHGQARAPGCSPRPRRGRTPPRRPRPDRPSESPGAGPGDHA